MLYRLCAYPLRIGKFHLLALPQDNLSTSDSVEVMVVATVAKAAWPSMVYLPSTTSSGAVPVDLERPQTFDTVCWPVRGILPMCSKQTAKEWSLVWGASLSTWKFVAKNQDKSKDGK